MFKRSLSITLFLTTIVAVHPGQAQNASEADMPVAPLAAVEFRGWTNAIVLRNPLVELAVAPSVGRIVQLSFKGGENLLRFDSSLQGVVPGSADEQTWLNVGGDWLWPVAQSTWPSFAGTDWPPPKALAEAEWTGTAWKDADGAQSCLLTREYGDPLHIRVNRLIKLDREAARVSIRQRIERLNDSDIPVTLWNITQIAGAENVILPVDKGSMFEKGLQPLIFGMPGEEQLTRCNGAAVYDATSGEFKLCSDSKRGWIAALKGDVLIIEQARGDTANGTYPDGGCTVEMYSNAGLGYTEIETLSVEVPLKPGESLQNMLVIDLIPAGTNRTACALAQQVCDALGEKNDIPAIEDSPVGPVTGNE
jgi:hypothetical protein